MSHLEVKKFAIKYEPPTFIIQYQDTSNGKNFLKNIRLKKVAGVDSGKLTNKLIKENPDLLGPSKVHRDQILDLVKLIVEHCHVDNGKKSSQTAVQLKIVEYGDLNKASDAVVERAKSEMNVHFEANRIQPNDTNFVWDKKVDFAPPVGTSEWDDDDC